jgi:hypothetical protein
MGRYIDDILQPGEKILYSTTIHGIIYVPGLACLAVAGACLVGSGGGVILPLLALSALLALVGGLSAVSGMVPALDDGNGRDLTAAGSQGRLHQAPDV